MSNTSKPLSSTSIVMQLLGLIAVTIITFLGLIYILNGEPYLTGFLSILTLVLLKVLVSNLIKRKENKNAYKDPGIEYMLLGLYALLFIILFPIGFHMLNIDIFQKDEIKKASLDKLAMLDTVKNDYSKAILNKQITFDINTQALYEQAKIYRGNYLRSLNNTLGTGTFALNDPASVTKAIEAVKDAINEKYELKQENKEVSDFKQSATPVFENWHLLNVNYEYKKIDTIFNKFQAAAHQKMPEFTTNAKLNNLYDLKSPFSSLKNGSIIHILFSLIGLLIIHWCILIPYIATERNTGGVIVEQHKYKPSEPGVL